MGFTRAMTAHELGRALLAGPDETIHALTEGAGHAEIVDVGYEHRATRTAHGTYDLGGKILVVSPEPIASTHVRSGEGCRSILVEA